MVGRDNGVVGRSVFKISGFWQPLKGVGRPVQGPEYIEIIVVLCFLFPYLVIVVDEQFLLLIELYL